MAQLTPIEPETSGFFKIKSIGSFISNFFQIVIALGTLAAFFYLILGGIEFITSGGNQEKTKSAREKITSALIGLAILASTWVIWRLVAYFLGLSPTAKGPFEIILPSP
jgi:hypothetical protein